MAQSCETLPPELVFWWQNMCYGNAKVIKKTCAAMHFQATATDGKVDLVHSNSS